jgi:cytochrome oxidase assembly protein ShyY1
MKNWRFASSGRWLGYLGLAVIFAIACVLLANWQIARRNEALAEIARVADNWEAAPRQVTDVLPTVDSWNDNDKWVPVTITGHYLVAQQLLVRGRPLNGDAGFEVLAPFQLANGRVFIVDRGWLPTGSSQDEPDSIPASPAGTETVVVRLKPSEPVVLGRSAPAGQIATIHLPDIAQRVGEPTYTGAYGLMATEDPATAVRPTPFDKPIADEGPHLSYAFQWIAFGVMGFFGLGWAIRQEYRILNSEDPEEIKRTTERKRKADAKPRSDAEVEDQLLDSLNR